jgi:hypothetical protein
MDSIGEKVPPPPGHADPDPALPDAASTRGERRPLLCAL